MLQQTQIASKPGLGGGLSTVKNPFSVQPTQSPNCMDVNFPIGDYLEKRLGSSTLNATVLVSSAATGFAPDSGGTLGTGLQAYWKLDEVSGSRIDTFGTNNLLSANAVGFAGGLVANAASFAAVNTMALSLLDNAVLRGSNRNFTFSGWVNLTTTGGNQQTQWAKTDGGSDNEYQLAFENNLRFIWRVAATGGTWNVAVSAPTIITQGAWNMVTVWHDSANAQVGIQLGTAAATSLAYSLGVRGGSATFIMGNDSAGALMTGLLDEVGFWNKILTTQEKTDLFNAGAGNTYNKGASSSGWGMFDFGAGLAGGMPLRYVVIAAGTGIYASSNRGLTFVAVATDRGADYQYFERSKSFLIATSETGNAVLYWAGSVGTFMSALAPGSAPPAKHALSFQGYLLLMNDSGGSRRISYVEEPFILTDAWASSFELPSSYDDEITGGIILNKKAYVSTKYKLFRVSFVGGNPFFAYQEVRNWGWVPGTQKKITLQNVGEVICALSWDKKLRIFDGAEDQVVSDAIYQDNGVCPFALSKIQTTSLRKSKAEVDTEDQIYKVLLAVAPSTETTSLLNFNFRTGAFYPYANQLFNGLVMAESGNSRVLLGISRDGYVHQLNSGNTDAGTAINAYYESAYEFGRIPRAVSKHQKLDLYLSPTSSGPLYIEDRTDFARAFTRRDTMVFTNTVAILQFMKTVDVPLTQNIYQYRLSDSGATAQPWRVNRVDRQFSEQGIGKA